MFLKETNEFIACIEYAWRDNHWVGLEGWLICKKPQPVNVNLEIDGHRLSIDHWLARPDICSKYKKFNPSLDCGFSLRLPQNTLRAAIFSICGEYDQSNVELPFEIGKVKPASPAIPSTAEPIRSFIDIVNQQHMRVLEIGSRLLLSQSKSKRHLFPDALSFIGFDIHPGPNVDVVGDAHKLSSYFPPESFDAIFSMSVLEHIAMPWVLVMEINKLLPIGGITYHHAPQSWPVHDLPWDFYRFSHQGLMTLFNKAMGFEVLAAGMGQSLRMSFDNFPPGGYNTFPLSPGFGGSAILAKKISPYDHERFRWDATTAEVLTDDSTYPKYHYNK